MRTLAALAAIGLSGFFAGCSNDSSGRCAQSSDCGSGQICDTGVCKTASTARTIGETCTSDANCSVGSSCATAMPGGLCTYNCAGDACPSGAVCTDLRASGSGIFCSTACTTQSDCRTGYTCCAGFGACVPAANCPAQSRPASATLGKQCSSNAQCTGAGELCGGLTGSTPEFISGTCTAACNPADQTTCPSGSKCVSTSTGSFCFPACSTPSDCGAVNPMFTSCTNGACRSGTASPSCTPDGTAPAAVNGGIPSNDPSSAPSSCQRLVQQSVLQTQPSGQQMVGNTITINVPAGTGAMSILSQGITTGSIQVSGGTQPPDTISFRGSPIANSVVPTLLKDPSGTTVYDDDPPTAPPADPSGMNVFYGGFSPWTGMMTVPNASPLLAHTALQGGLTPGTWQFKVNDFALECANPAHATDCGASKSLTSVYDIQVLLKPGVAPATGTLDVAFYVVFGTASTNANTVIADPSFTRMVRSLAQLYAAAGICLGKVTVYDVPSWAKTKFGGSLNADDDSACGDLGQLFTLSAPGNQINLFLVNGFKNAAGASINVVGVDGTIPGPSSVGGTISSGAAVNGSDLDANAAFCGSGFDPLSCGADEVAFIAAHEGGHYLGLYHTTEQFGDSFDPLSDTKTCACTSCVPANMQASCASNHPSGTPVQVTNNFCVSTNTTPVCGGGDNMMFWLLRAESRGTLTPQQGQVMRANPLVR